jgi:hypothetical protein
MSTEQQGSWQPALIDGRCSLHDAYAEMPVERDVRVRSSYAIVSHTAWLARV